MNSKEDIVEQKQNLIQYFEKIVRQKGSLEKVKRDPHTRRLPRPCGITVHLGKHCPLACSYCYIEEMGFQFKKTEPYPLTPEETILALLYNPAFIPGRLGTFIALGSIVDPFYPSIRSNTLQFIKLIAEHLKNPTQFSTKLYLDELFVGNLRDAVGKETLSPLVTIITTKASHKLEPKAPTPLLRFRTIENLHNAGFKPFIFIRPIIPGVTDLDANEILEMGVSHKTEGIVAGSLRVTKGIIERLRSAGIDVNPILRRLTAPLSNRQISIRTSDIKSKIMARANELGLLAYNSACCANAYTSDVPCFGLCFYTRFCVSCPNNCPSKIPKFDEDYLHYVLKELYNLKDVYTVLNKNNRIYIDIPKKAIRHINPKFIEIALRTIFRRYVKIKFT